MELLNNIFAASLGAILSCILTLLSIWFKHWLDHRPLYKQSMFSDYEICPNYKNNIDNAISVANAQCIDFDFSKENRSFVSLVYKFQKTGLLSGYTGFDFDVVFEEGNYTRIVLEIKVLNPRRQNQVKTASSLSLDKPSTEDMNKPIKYQVNFKDLKNGNTSFDDSDIHNLREICFVVFKKNKDESDTSRECYGKFQIRNIALRKQ